MKALWNAEIQTVDYAKEHICKDFDTDPELAKMRFDGKVVLDYGCGIGRNLPYLTRSGARLVLGYDFPNMIRLATEYLDQDVLIKVLLLSSPLNIALRFAPKVDVVITILVFQHMEILDLQEALDVLHSRMNVDGLLYVFGRGYLDEQMGSVWLHILKNFEPVTTFDPYDQSENHQRVTFRRRK